MPLQFNATWRFEPKHDPAPRELREEFLDLINRIKAQGDEQEILEAFKSRFASAAGSTSAWSSNAGWAQTDLFNYMEQASANGPLFIEAFFDGCQWVKRTKGFGVPDAYMLNRVLARHEAGYQIEEPNTLVRVGAKIDGVEVPAVALSLDQQALSILQQSLSTAEQLLAEGNGRAAVQELLWLLETVSTAYRGVDTEAGTVEGKYFNKIVRDLKSKRRGTKLEAILGWMETLHGYLSSPTGGGIRHGGEVSALSELQEHEAHLLCNLIKSYIRFLLEEHHRLVGPSVLS